MSDQEQCEHRDIDDHAICLECGVEGYWYWDDGKCWSPKADHLSNDIGRGAE